MESSNRSLAFFKAGNNCPGRVAQWVTCLATYVSLTAGPRSAVGNVSGYRCVSDCRSRGREFDPGPVPYFRGD